MNMVPVNGNFCAPSPVKFTPVFSVQPLNFFWDFGIASEFYQQDTPTITYLLPGTYQVKLTALFQNKIVEAIQNVTIFGMPVFTAIPDRDYICQPGAIVFTAQSTEPIASYSWNFGDGTPDFAQPSGIISHSYVALGNYTANVEATTTAGCFSQKSISISVNNLTATLFNNPKNGCLPANTSLEAKVLVPEGSSVSEYKWNFGDGTPEITGTSNKVSHVYVNPSGGKPVVKITTTEGCTNSFTFDSLFFGNAPQPVVVSAEKTSICFSETGKFKAYANGANTYEWDFGDNTSLLTTDTAISHKFSSLNIFKVQVTPFFNGCKGSAVSLDISVVGVKSSFGSGNYCANRDSFTLYSNSLGPVSSYLWNFGDGSPNANVQVTNHIFPSDGKFTSTLIVFDSLTNCRDTVAGYIFTKNPKLIATDSFVCINTMVTLKVEGVDSEAEVAFFSTLMGENRWNYGPNYNFVTQNADSAGIFKNRVIVYIAGGYCPDTLNQILPLRVGGPLSDFTGPEYLCISDEMVVQNKTKTAFSFDPVVNWSWNFGDSLHSDRKQLPSPFTYDKPGKYWISLKVADSKGCMDSLRKQTIVNPLPFIAVSSSTGIVCPGDSIQLNAIFQGKVKWLPFSQVSCDTCSSIIVNPILPIIYTAISSDSIGCSSSFNVPVNVYIPYSFNPVSADTGFCNGGSVQLNFGEQGDGLIYRWTPAAGLSDPTIYNPVASPSSSTIYQVNVVDSAGCFPLTAKKNVAVYPLPLIDSGPPVIVPYNSAFSLNPTYGPDIVSYNWTPINQLNCTNCAYPSGIALASMIYTVTATTSKGCTASTTLQLQIECKAENLLMPTAFSPNGDNLNDYFYPIARGLDLINKFTIYNRYGKIIFERNNFKPNEKLEGWNGYVNGKAQASGSFLYVLQAVCNRGNVINKKGTFTLIK